MPEASRDALAQLFAVGESVVGNVTRRTGDAAARQTFFEEQRLAEARRSFVIREGVGRISGRRVKRGEIENPPPLGIGEDDPPLRLSRS